VTVGVGYFASLVISNLVDFIVLVLFLACVDVLLYFERRINHPTKACAFVFAIFNFQDS